MKDDGVGTQQLEEILI